MYAFPVLFPHRGHISSDLWAIGCTLFFMVAGTPPFAAINDYQSFRKIEALDYTFPEGFYDSAKDLVQRLVVCLSNDLVNTTQIHCISGARPVRTSWHRAEVVAIECLPAEEDEDPIEGEEGGELAGEGLEASAPGEGSDDALEPPSIEEDAADDEE